MGKHGVYGFVEKRTRQDADVIASKRSTESVVVPIIRASS